MSEFIENTVFRSEEWQQKAGKGILELRGGKLEMVLFVNGEPLVFHAYDCEGSVARFVALFSDNPLETDQLIRELAVNGFAANTPLHEQIAPLLPLFPKGDYHLRLEQVHQYNSYLRSGFEQLSPQTSVTLPETRSYYPFDSYYTLVWTQSELLLDEEIVNKYMAMIKSGRRPALITVGLSDHWSRFIIDGHHKYAAYRRCGIGPHTLHIELEEIEPVSNELAQQILGHDSDEYKNYLWYKDELTSS